VLTPACRTRASSARLERIQPVLWKHRRAAERLQTSARRAVRQIQFHKLRAAAMRVQPWYRGCHERSKRILATRTAAVVVVQSWARRMSARALRDRRQWASDEIGLWLVEETWIGPIVDQHRLRTDVVAPELVDEFLFTGSDFFETSVCAGVARRRDAGATILEVLRHRPRHYPPSRLAGKPPSGWRGPRVLMHPAALRQNDRSEEEGRGKGSLDGVARAKVRVFVRHRSATLLNRTANAWVHYVKMERAWRPLLAFQVCRVFLRRCARTQSICERRLRRNVAAVRLQAAARGYVLRRARGEAHAATAVAAWWRGRQQWRRYRLLNASAIRIETAQRRSSVQATYWWISEKRSRRFAQSAVKQGFAVRDGIMGSRAWHPDHDFPMAEGLGHRHAHHAYLPTR
jgi:hypothetical protein